jgi:methylated-DNA-protein-cysteine methyltransferase-like protein
VTLPPKRSQSAASRTGTYARIYAVIQRVPRGRVATYGQIASLAGLGGHARQVGYALSSLPEGSRVPWHRVINAKGEVSLRSERRVDTEQRRLLEAEGVLFDQRGRVSLSRFQWRPRRRPEPA